jgi:hypothetical protein
VKKSFVCGGAALAVLITAIAGGGRALAQSSVDCESLEGPIIYGLGGSAQAPLIGQIAAKLAGASGDDHLTVVYSSPGACFALDGLKAEDATPVTTAASYWLADGTQQPCVLPDEGVEADFGSMQNGPALCPGYDALPDGLGDFLGPVGTINFIVPTQSSQNAISAEAAYFVFGFGKDGKVDPWVDDNFIIRRNETSAVQLYIGLATGVPAASFKGIDAKTNGDSINLVATAPDPEVAVGFVSGENADKSRDKVRTLAYQHTDQACGYWPDSSATAFDKNNVRDGLYHLWGATHFYAKVDDKGAISDPDVQRFVGYITGAVEPPDELPILDIFIKNYNVPQCAMHVKREVDLGPIASFQADEPCDCYFDEVATGSTKCDACEADADCDKTAPKCRRGYCEVK